MSNRKVSKPDTKKRLPERQFGEGEKGVAMQVMRNIANDNDNDPRRCWETPRKWPVDRWGPKPDGYLVSLAGNGYGQFTLLPVWGVSRQKTFDLHKLSFQYLLPELIKSAAQQSTTVLQARFEGTEIEFIGAAYVKQNAQRTIDPKLVRMLRHGHGVEACTSRSCMNPFHLRIGTPAMNSLDRAIQVNKDKSLPPKAEAKRDAVIADFDGGDFIAKRLADKHGIAQWHVARIIQEAYPLRWKVLLHDFNPSGFVDNRSSKKKRT